VFYTHLETGQRSVNLHNQTFRLFSYTTLMAPLK